MAAADGWIPGASPGMTEERRFSGRARRFGNMASKRAVTHNGKAKPKGLQFGPALMARLDQFATHHRGARPADAPLSRGRALSRCHAPGRGLDEGGRHGRAHRPAAERVRALRGQQARASRDHDRLPHRHRRRCRALRRRPRRARRHRRGRGARPHGRAARSCRRGRGVRRGGGLALLGPHPHLVGTHRRRQGSACSTPRMPTASASARRWPRAGGDAKAYRSCIRKKGDIAAYLELHIEQGPVLEAKGLALAAVTAINGSVRSRVAVTGFAGHAGTVPMGARRDALAAASEMVLAIERHGWRGDRARRNRRPHARAAGRAERDPGPRRVHHRHAQSVRCRAQARPRGPARRAARDRQAARRQGRDRHLPGEPGDGPRSRRRSRPRARRSQRAGRSRCGSPRAPGTTPASWPSCARPA